MIGFTTISHRHPSFTWRTAAVQWWKSGKTIVKTTVRDITLLHMSLILKFQRHALIYTD